MTEENPYPEMPADVLAKHIEQISAVIKEKKVDVTQFFGGPISEEDKNKIDKFDSLTSEVKTLSEAASSKDLSNTEVILSQTSIDRVVSDIKKIDKDAPLESVSTSKFNNLEKIQVYGIVEGIVTHYAGREAAIRKELAPGGDKGTTEQQFSKPEIKSGDAEALVKTITEKLAPETS